MPHDRFALQGYSLLEWRPFGLSLESLSDRRAAQR
jgi:hypothetical protein